MKGCLDFKNTMTESLYKGIMKNLNLSGKDWEDMAKLLNGHPMVKLMNRYPNEEVAAKAKTFTKEILN